MIGTGWYDAYDAYFAYVNGSQMNNMTGNGEMITYTQAIQGLQMATSGAVTFAGNQSVTNLSYAFDLALPLINVCIDLTSQSGVNGELP